jgi:hypothetical protein
MHRHFFSLNANTNNMKTHKGIKASAVPNYVSELIVFQNCNSKKKIVVTSYVSSVNVTLSVEKSNTFHISK